MRTGYSRLLSLVVSLIITLLAPCMAAASDDIKAVPEFTMKAAYLYNFALLTNWPAKTEAPENNFNLCLYGQNELAPALEALQGKMINQQQLRLLRVNDATQARQCHMLFIGEEEALFGSHLVESLKGTPVLIVTDANQVARSGAMLLITTKAHRLSFEVNIDYAKRSQLKFSSKLLRLATKVNGE